MSLLHQHPCMHASVARGTTCSRQRINLCTGSTQPLKPQLSKHVRCCYRRGLGSFRSIQRDSASETQDGPSTSAPSGHTVESQTFNRSRPTQRWTWPSAMSATETRLLGFMGAAAGAGLLGSGFDFQGPGSVIQALGVLAAIITVHECGHFLAAKLQGIHVTQFAIGFGPALFKYKVCAHMVSVQ